MSTAKNPHHISVVYDAIHSSIYLDPIAQQIIASPFFTRLKKIKQLQGDAIFISATHTRFAHCIGTYHISQLWMECLESSTNMEEECYSKSDWKFWKECVTIAALIHDLGHLAYSHTLDDILKHEHGVISHEERSVEFLKLMVKKNHVTLITQDHLELIGALVLGRPIENEAKGLTLKNYPSWLFEIVNNKKTDLDADKFDYLQRDAKMTNKAVLFEYRDIIRRSKIIKGELCFHIDTLRSIYQVFHTRYNLFREVYKLPAIIRLNLTLESNIKKWIQSIDSEKFNETFNNLESVQFITDDVMDVNLSAMTYEEIEREYGMVTEWLPGALATEWLPGALATESSPGTLVTKRPNGIKSKEPESAKSESAKSESAKSESAKSESAKSESKEPPQTITIQYRYTNLPHHPILHMNFYDDEDRVRKTTSEDMVGFALPSVIDVQTFTI